ncbi:hypothetical protein [Beijerinckia indica]|uniref:Uncharacterized protein n=1 Tax=Beijerinckia indica subsp. indica (strain ATCC 9039 / DSM 1715 / NCIMB 8712) TaxID=395963 RepID=B2IER7_BEII9|nr:hypothetical protein [Beijerinckia indica]ACB97007.1 hypothetical protein Bind_3450 [Beijerinckia indica subsp. indica ATCC 9039]
MKFSSLIMISSLAVIPSFAMAQQLPSFIAPATAPVLNAQGPIAGTIPSTGPNTNNITTTNAYQSLGIGHRGAGTGGTSQAIGNAAGSGLHNLAVSVFSGGTRDYLYHGTLTGGVLGGGLGLRVGSGGIGDRVYSGAYTGGLRGTMLGASTGGINDMVAIGATTGGIHDNNAPRFWVPH